MALHWATPLGIAATMSGGGQGDELHVRRRESGLFQEPLGAELRLGRGHGDPHAKTAAEPSILVPMWRP
jgi:hypothetical protein